MRILWADDQQEVARTLSLGISRTKEHRVTFAIDGNQAVSFLKQGFFDIAILDLAMPPGTWGGLWVLEQLREIGLRVPAVVLSGEGKQPETIKALRLGARDFVTKEQANSELEVRLLAVLNELWSEIHKEILTSFPSPLALTYKRYSTSSTPQAKMRSLIDIYEHALRLAGIVGLAEARDNGVGLSDQIISQLGRPSVGTWHEVARGLFKGLPPESLLTRFWRAIDDRLVTELVNTRNNIAHGYEFGDRKAESWLMLHEPPMRAWLSRVWQQVPFRLFAVLSSAFDGRTMSHSTVALEGESPVLPKRAVSSVSNLVLHHVYMQGAGKNESMVSLYPFLLADPGDELNTWRAYFFDGWKANRKATITNDHRLRYLELWTGIRTDDLGPTSSSLPGAFFSKI